MSAINDDPIGARWEGNQLNSEEKEYWEMMLRKDDEKEEGEDDEQ